MRILGTANIDSAGTRPISETRAVPQATTQRHNHKRDTASSFDLDLDKGVVPPRLSAVQK